MQIAQLANSELTPLDIRIRLFENGYHPVIARGKISDVAGWRTPVDTVDTITALTAANKAYKNTGLLCGALVALDIDAPDPATAASLLAIADTLPGSDRALRRIGKAPKICLFFRASEVGKKRTTKAYIVNGVKCQVEVMGDGQQVLGFGIHPDTQMPYEWIGPSPLDVAFADLPEISPEDIVSFVERAEEYLREHGDPMIKPRDDAPAATHYQPSQQRTPAGDGVWSELKSKAMANLGAWVPALGLSGTKPYEQGFLARADFRPSTSSTGKTGARRGLSVCFSPDGICDYADGNRGYNPIDIVSVCLGIEASEAADWLRSKIGDERPPHDPYQYSGLISRSLLAGKSKVGSQRNVEYPPIAANDNKLDAPNPPPMHENPYAAAAAGGLMADIAGWIVSTSVVKVPELALTAALALMAGVFGSRALTPTRSGVNVFATTIVRTAGGKGRPPSAIRALADRAVPGGVVSNSDPTSFAAFERILRRNSSVVAVMDEFGLTLQGVNSKKHDPAAASIRKFLLSIYDQADGTFDGKAYANADTKKDDSPIVGPALTVLSMTTAETLYKGVSQDSVNDGFLNRFVFVESAPNPEGVKPPDLSADNSPPQSIVHDLRKAVETFPAKVEMPGKSAKNKHRVPFDGGLGGAAHKAWEEVFLWQHNRAWDETQSKIRGRAAENTIRIATLRAISRNPWRPAVTVDDVRWGWAIVFKSIAIMEAGIKSMVGSAQEECRNSIINALKKSKDGVLYRSRLMRLADVKKHSMQDYTASMAWLYASGDVIDISEDGDGSKLQLTSQDGE